MSTHKSQEEVCEIVFSTNQSQILLSEFFKNFLINITYIIKIDIEHHVAYVHKNGLEDPFFRRLKLIVWLILVRSQILS